MVITLAVLVGVCVGLACWVRRLRTRLRVAERAWEADVDTLHADLCSAQKARRRRIPVRRMTGSVLYRRGARRARVAGQR